MQSLLSLQATQRITPMFRRGVRRAAIADKMTKGHPQLVCGEANP